MATTTKQAIKKGSKVKFTTHRGRAGTGTVSGEVKGERGSFWTVKEPDGSEVKLRYSQMTPA